MACVITRHRSKVGGCSVENAEFLRCVAFRDFRVRSNRPCRETRGEGLSGNRCRRMKPSSRGPHCRRGQFFCVYEEEPSVRPGLGRRYRTGDGECLSLTLRRSSRATRAPDGVQSQPVRSAAGLKSASYRVRTKGQEALKVRAEITEPIKAWIEEEASVAYRPVAGLRGMTKNTVPRVLQLRSWQARKRPTGARPPIEAIPSGPTRSKELLVTELSRAWGGRDGGVTSARVMDFRSRDSLSWHLAKSGKSTRASAAIKTAGWNARLGRRYKRGIRRDRHLAYLR